MAITKFDNKNNQKKTASVFAAITSEASGELFTLPVGSYVTSITAVETADSTDGEAVVAGIEAGTYYPTGADVTVSGITSEELIVVEYIEIDLTNGQYTD